MGFPVSMPRTTVTRAQMKLLFVSLYIDHILYFFLERLAKEVSLTVIFDLENEWSQRLQATDIRTLRYSPRSKFDHRFREYLDALAAEHSFDLVQSFHGNAQLANLIRWNRGRLPLVAYRARIGHLKFRENPMVYFHVRNPTLAGVVVVSTEVKRYLESFRFLRPRNVRVIHHGIDRQWVESQLETPYPLRAELSIPDDALIVASMAALRPVKRFDYVVHAAKQLRGLPVHFVHIGEPRGWDQRAAGLPNIHFLGPKSQPLPILAAADVFAMTSHNEAFGRANLEAMACGKPVIGSNTGGLLDLVVPGVTGELFETTSADDFAACVERYYRKRERVAEHGANALARVEAGFTSEHMLASYVDLYREVLADRAA